MKKRMLSLLTTVCMLTAFFPVMASAAGNTAVIELSDDGVTVDGERASTSASSAVYVGADIVYYEDGTDDTYGAGTEDDMHTAEEAAAHTVVTITEPGTYSISGTLSAGQIAVDLGEEAEDDPDAVVTLILNGVDLTCTVAPAIVFYHVYECCATDEENAASIVDTSGAGANIIIADHTVNTVNGSYVAKIYQEGTTSKLYKFDGAIHSLMSMNVDGGDEGTGTLNIYAENEGLDSDIDLTVNGGIISIYAGNDGINTSEDNVSVFTMNGGSVYVENTGATGEGDGIDSNGWIVINGGTIIAGACTASQDSGIDSDLGITINGGTVLAYGSMYDEIESDSQTFIMLSFAQTQSGVGIVLYDDNGDEAAALSPASDFSILVYSSADLTAGDYTLYLTDSEGNSSILSAVSTEGGMTGGMPEGMEPPEGFDGTGIPEGMEPPEDFSPTDLPEGTDQAADFGPIQPGGTAGGAATEGTRDVFTIAEGGNFFYQVSTAAATYTGLPFSDIARSDSCYEAVKYFYENGIMIGTSDTAFSPGGSVTRAMAITVLGRLQGVEESETSDFSDVVADAWYSGYVGWAQSSGIVEGYGDGTFGVDDTLTAAQLQLVIDRYATLRGIDYTINETAGSESVTRAELAETLFTLFGE